MQLHKEFGPIAITVLCEYVYWNFRGEELAIIVWIFFRYMLIIHNAENLLEEFLGWFLRSTAKMIATCHSIQKWIGIIGYAAKNLQGASKNNVRLKEKKIEIARIQPSLSTYNKNNHNLKGVWIPSGKQSYNGTTKIYFWWEFIPFTCFKYQQKALKGFKIF